jgi:hypothetical protein
MVVDVSEVNISEVQRHEEATAANARLGRYEMGIHCPANEFLCFRVLLEQSDTDRLFLLGDFAERTTDRTCRIRDVKLCAADLPRVASFVTARVDLRSQAGLELVLVCRELHKAPLIIIDGNHRAIAHYLTQGSMLSVPAYVCVHQAISQWPFVPNRAR